MCIHLKVQSFENILLWLWLLKLQYLYLFMVYIEFFCDLHLLPSNPNFFLTFLAHLPQLGSSGLQCSSPNHRFVYSCRRFLWWSGLTSAETCLAFAEARFVQIQSNLSWSTWIKTFANALLTTIWYVVCHDDVIKPTIMFGKVSLKLSMKLLPKQDYFERKLKL